MKFVRDNKELETLNLELNNPEQLKSYKEPFDNYKTGFLPRILGGLLVGSGNFIYGSKPSYLKFRAVEVIARVPYHSWSSVAYTLLTMFYSDEKRALRLSDVTKYARIAQDNETMHVVVVSHLTRLEEKIGFIRHSLIPMIFAFFYFWASYFLYLFSPRSSLELNYLFEQHAFDQYSLFLEFRGEELKKKPVDSEFLRWYGRNPRNQYEFFLSVRNDEIIHRNQSIKEISAGKTV
ncbi:MAG: alternative oxidase [Patescibacteria group bacterium]